MYVKFGLLIVCFGFFIVWVINLIGVNGSVEIKSKVIMNK